MSTTTLPCEASPPPRMPAALPPALAGQRFMFDGLACYTAGNGPPMLLVHSINATASAAEVRPLFDALQARYTVFAPDLPGFGSSQRDARAYTPRLMTDALHATVAQIRQRCGAVPVDAVAVSLGCEFLARAAAEQPRHFARLALVSPTGLTGRRDLRAPEGSTRERRWLHRLLTAPGWGPWLYRQLTHPGVVRYFLRRAWGSPQIDTGMWRYAVQTARMPGASHAPLQFIAGRLFSTDIHRVYEALAQPVWVSQGLHGDFTDFRALDRVPLLSRWPRSRFDTGALPYFEQPALFLKQLNAFLDKPRQAQRSAQADQPFRRRQSLH